MNTSTVGFFGMIGLLCVACGGSVEPVGGNGAGGEDAGGGGVGGVGPGGGVDGGADIGGAGEGGAGEGGAGEGGAPTACALMELVSISDPQLYDAGGDLVWSPGETAVFSVALTNDANEDNFNYPGVKVSSSLAGITGGENMLFGIFAGEETQVFVSVSASDTLQSGTEVELFFSVTTPTLGCGKLGSSSVIVALE